MRVIVWIKASEYALTYEWVELVDLLEPWISVKLSGCLFTILHHMPTFWVWNKPIFLFKSNILRLWWWIYLSNRTEEYLILDNNRHKQFPYFILASSFFAILFTSNFLLTLLANIRTNWQIFQTKRWIKHDSGQWTVDTGRTLYKFE